MIITNPTAENLKKVEEFVLNHPNGNFFQSLLYYDFYKSLPAYEPILLISTDELGIINGSLLAVIQKENGYLKGKLSSRCIIYGGPIVSGENKEVTNSLLQKLIKQVSGKAIYIEFRNLFNLSECKDVFRKKGFEYKDHYNFVVGIGMQNDNLNKLDRNRRWQINKSLKEGAIIVEAKDLIEVKEFYLMLKNLYKEKVKKPLPDFSFFERFFEQKGLGKYFLVKFEDRIIGGTMCPIFMDTIYEWYKCSLDKEYKNLYPGSLATWAPIEHAAKNGLNYFDFLGAGSADSDYGVREFKSKFGGELVKYGRFLKINKRIIYFIAKKYILLKQKAKN